MINNEFSKQSSSDSTVQLFFLEKNKNKNFVFAKIKKKVIKKILNAPFLNCRYCSKVFVYKRDKNKKNHSFSEN